LSSYFEKLASVRDVLNLKNVKANGVLIIPETMPFVDTARFLAAHDVGMAVVTNEKKIIAGVVSERDLVRCIAAHAEEFLAMVVRDFMSRDVRICAPNDHLKSLASKMAHSHVRHVVVRDGERCIGVVSARDILLFAGDG